MTYFMSRISTQQTYIRKKLLLDDVRSVLISTLNLDGSIYLEGEETKPNHTCFSVTRKNAA